MNLNKRTTHIRILVEDKEKLKALSRELSVIQGKDITISEAARRAFRTADKQKLILDAELKRGLSQ